MERRRIVFSGRVQGVGFRATALALAQSHGLTGWVRNESDGSVMLEVQGEPAPVAAYLADLRRTMDRRIEGETVGTLAIDPGEQSFQIRH